MDYTEIAKICHEANRAYCQILKDHTQVPWESAPKWLQQSVIDGVSYALMNPDVTPEQSHANWFKKKWADGWKYGRTKNDKKQTHPLMVPFADLPDKHKTKDRLFLAIIKAIAGK